MSIPGYLRAHWLRVSRAWVHWRLRNTAPRISIERSNWDLSLKNPTAFYLECTRYFEQRLRPELRLHRAYFYNVPGNRRGYGENAFHVMWDLLGREFKPRNFLEIGIFRGQVISLLALCSRLNGLPCDIAGISPFSAAGDSVSKYREDIDYYQDTLANFEHFQLPPPRLLRAYSTDAQALELIASSQWEMIYIDGNHDYTIASQDWQACSRALKAGGIIVLDDSGLTSSYKPPAFSSRGHPGPSQLAEEIDPKAFREILQVGHNRAFQKL